MLQGMRVVQGGRFLRVLLALGFLSWQQMTVTGKRHQNSRSVACAKAEAKSRQPASTLS